MAATKKEIIETLETAKFILDKCAKNSNSVTTRNYIFDISNRLDLVIIKLKSGVLTP